MTSGSTTLELKSATLSFELSGDGKSVSNGMIEFAMNESAPDGDFSTTGREIFPEKAAVQGGKFVLSDPNTGSKVDGQVTSPTSTKGTAHLVYLNMSGDSGGSSSPAPIDLGSWQWTASPQPPTAP